MQLIDGFEFPSSAHRVKITPDGQYLIVTGTYIPSFKVFELNQLSMKLERHTIAEYVDFQVFMSEN